MASQAASATATPRTRHGAGVPPPGTAGTGSPDPCQAVFSEEVHPSLARQLPQVELFGQGGDEVGRRGRLRGLLHTGQHRRERRRDDDHPDPARHEQLAELDRPPELGVAHGGRDVRHRAGVGVRPERRGVRQAVRREGLGETGTDLPAGERQGERRAEPELAARGSGPLWPAVAEMTES